jgi:hypothetical protein
MSTEDKAHEVSAGSQDQYRATHTAAVPSNTQPEGEVWKRRDAKIVEHCGQPVSAQRPYLSEAQGKEDDCYD